MALLTPPPAAPQRGDRTTFASRVDAFITWLINFVSELVSLVANLNSIAAGGAYAIPYSFSYSLTPVGTVAGGWVGWPSANRGLFYVDTKSASGAAIANTLASIAASNGSAIKAQLRVQKVNDPKKWILYSITSYTADSSGKYGFYGVALLDSSQPSDNSPFSEGDAVVLFFQRTGDKGDKGDNGTSITPIIWIRDEKPSGTASGNPVTGYNVRTLNTVTRNTISGASLASNRVTLPAGTYRYLGSAPANGVGAHQGLVFNITDNINLVAGTSEYSAGSYTTRSQFCGDMTISKTTVFELRHWAGTSSGSFGAPVGSGNNEVYSELIFEKIG